MKKKGLILWILAICVLLAAAYTFYVKYKPQQDNVQRIAADDGTKVAAPDFTLKDLSGKEVSLSDFKGRLVVLNFWAVWCQYCKLEMPELNELDEELEKGEDAVLLTVDVQEDEKTVRDYLDSEGIAVRVLMDSEGEAARKYGINSLPNTFIIDREGNAVAYIAGPTDKATLERLIGEYR